MNASPEFERFWRDEVQTLPPADWIVKFCNDYWETGYIDPVAYYRIFGDPGKGVTIASGDDPGYWF